MFTLMNWERKINPLAFKKLFLKFVVIVDFLAHFSTYCFTMKGSKYIDLNSIHITSPRLMSIPAKEIEIKIEKEYREKLKIEGKEEFIVCCNSTRDFLVGAIKLNITRRELDILKSVLNKHPYDRFGGNKYYNKTTHEIDINSLIEKVFEVSQYFDSKAVAAYFLNEFYRHVQKENESSRWALTLAEFNVKWEKKYSEYSLLEASIQISKAFFSVKDIKKQLAKGDFKNVVEMLISNSDKISNRDIANSLIILSGEYSEIELEKIKGIIPEETYSLRRRKAVDSLLKLIDQLE